MRCSFSCLNLVIVSTIWYLFLMSNRKILIVDDEPQVQKLLETVLVPKNYQLMSASNGLDALRQMNNSKPDLVILDIMMPEMSGIELCQKIKAEPQYQDVLVLMVSAKDSQNDRLAGLSYGADDYVTKPFRVSTLVNKIDYMLQKVGK